MVRPLALGVLSLWLVGCTPAPVIRAPSSALPVEQAAQTFLGHWAGRASRWQDGLSGFRLLVEGSEAFALRAALLDHAQRTLDVQTYLVDDGLTSRVLLQRMLGAAERGVRVRLLLDDLASIGKQDALAALDSHPNIEVRLFNPLLAGRDSLLTRGLMMAFDLDRQHRRMHNKLWVVDNAVAIAGGRNLGDEYFSASRERNFADLDVMTAGPVAHQLSASFDDYWGHDLAVPLRRFEVAEAEAWRRLLVDLNAWIAEQQADSPYFRALRRRYGAAAEDALIGPLHWAPGQALWDPPQKIASAGRPELDQTLAGQLMDQVDALDDRLLIISAYFVPAGEGGGLLRSLSTRGVDITLITNSLAATDLPAVHGAYVRHRQALLENGARIFELRGDAQEGYEPSLGVPGSSSSSLHIKALGFDDDRLFIGSFNVDARSMWWNSEVGVLIDSSALNAELWELAALGMSPSLSYAVRRGDDGALRWHAEVDGEAVVLDREPGGTWRHFHAWLSRLLGLEELL